MPPPTGATPGTRLAPLKASSKPNFNTTLTSKNQAIQRELERAHRKKGASGTVPVEQEMVNLERRHQLLKELIDLEQKSSEQAQEKIEKKGSGGSRWGSAAADKPLRGTRVGANAKTYVDQAVEDEKREAAQRRKEAREKKAFTEGFGLETMTGGAKKKTTNPEAAQTTQQPKTATGVFAANAKKYFQHDLARIPKGLPGSPRQRQPATNKRLGGHVGVVHGIDLKPGAGPANAEGTAANAGEEQEAPLEVEVDAPAAAPASLPQQEAQKTQIAATMKPVVDAVLSKTAPAPAPQPKPAVQKAQPKAAAAPAPAANPFAPPPAPAAKAGPSFASNLSKALTKQTQEDSGNTEQLKLLFGPGPLRIKSSVDPSVVTEIAGLNFPAAAAEQYIAKAAAATDECRTAAGGSLLSAERLLFAFGLPAVATSAETDLAKLGMAAGHRLKFKKKAKEVREAKQKVAAPPATAAPAGAAPAAARRQPTRLSEGTYDEAAQQASFTTAVIEWRRARAAERAAAGEDSSAVPDVSPASAPPPAAAQRRPAPASSSSTQNGGGSLLDGTYDEASQQASFTNAVMEWRSARAAERAAEEAQKTAETSAVTSCVAKAVSGGVVADIAGEAAVSEAEKALAAAPPQPAKERPNAAQILAAGEARFDVDADGRGVVTGIGEGDFDDGGEVGEDDDDGFNFATLGGATLEGGTGPGGLGGLFTNLM